MKIDVSSANMSWMLRLTRSLCLVLFWIDGKTLGNDQDILFNVTPKFILYIKKILYTATKYYYIPRYQLSKSKFKCKTARICKPPHEVI